MAHAQTGAFLWTATTSLAIVTAPAVANGMVYVGSNKLYAFDANSGALRWSAYAFHLPGATP